MSAPAKLWDKGYTLDPRVERFEVGDSLAYDQRLVVADVLGSIAHAAGLVKIGLLPEADFHALRVGLAEIAALDARGDVRAGAGRRGRAHQDRELAGRQRRRGRQEHPHRPLAQRPGAGRPAPLRPRCRAAGRSGRAGGGRGAARPGPPARADADAGLHAHAARHALLGRRLGRGLRRGAAGRPDAAGRRRGAQRPVPARLGRLLRRAAAARAPVRQRPARLRARAAQRALRPEHARQVRGRDCRRRWRR